MKRMIHCYPTLRCNGKCSYCSNVPPGGGAFSYCEKLPGHWVKLMNQLHDWDFHFTGGEIFLFHGIKDVLEGIPVTAKFYTNAMLLIDKSLIGSADPNRVVFRCSYHPSNGSIDQFLQNVETLKEMGMPFQIFMVDIPENNALGFRVGVFRENGYEIGIDYDQRKHAHKKGIVECLSRTIIVSPEGTVFPCVSKMVRHKDELVNLFEREASEIMEEIKPFICSEPEACTPCDLAASHQKEIG